MPTARLSTTALALALALTSCSALPPEFVQWAGNEKKSLGELDYPGFFDVGVGFGFATRQPFDETNAGGVLLSLRAYPAGRWYSTLKSSGATAAKVLESTVASAVAGAMSLTSANLVEDDAIAYYRAVLRRPEDSVSAKLAAARNEENFLAVNGLMNPVAKAIHKSKLDEVAELLVAVGAVAKDANDKAQAAADAAAAAANAAAAAAAAAAVPPIPTPDEVTAAKAKAPLTASITPETLTDEESVMAAAKKVDEAARANGAALVIDEESLTVILGNLAKAESTLNSTEWIVVEERDTWLHRIAVFYGRTIDDLGGSFDAPADVIGLSYDIAPQFAIVAGWAFVDGDGDTSSSLYLGTSLNLNAFKEFFGNLFGS